MISEDRALEIYHQAAVFFHELNMRLLTDLDRTDARVFASAVLARNLMAVLKTQNIDEIDRIHKKVKAAVKERMLDTRN